GQFYLFEFPLVVIGIYQAIVKKYPWRNFLFVWGVITIAIASLTRDVPHATRSFFLIAPVEIFSALGLLFCIKYIIHVSKKEIRYVLGSILIFLALYNTMYYFSSYYIRFPVLYAKQWRAPDKELSLFLKENQDKYKK